MKQSHKWLFGTVPVIALIFSEPYAQAHNGHSAKWTAPSGYQLPDGLARAEMEAAANQLPATDWTPVLASVRRPFLKQVWPQAEPEEAWLPVSFGAAVAAPGNGPLLMASFSPFKPRVRFYNNTTHFFVESDSMPDAVLMPSPMVGITAWQQQLPHPVGYFGNVTNPETATGSLGFGQPNVWRIPLVPVAAASPVTLTGNFLRGAVALGANGIPIFNPRNNTGQFSQAIGELDAYGGHCGRADDYHYHIAPTHLYGALTPDKPCAWALDGYPIYGYVEPDGSALQALDADGGHDHGAWGYHYHARGTYSAATGKWTPSNPYLMNAMHGTVVNFGGQIDPQPTASSIAPAGAPLAGAVITGFTPTGTDAWVMTYTVGGTPYSVTTSVNRIAHTVTVNQQTPTDPVGTPATYTNAGRFNYYPLSGPSMLKLPDTGQSLNATATFGEDSDYTRNPPSFTDNGNGTVTDNNTGLMWQKTDSGEMTWDTARTTATALNLAGFNDWRLPTAQEAFCIQNHERNPSLDPAYFVESAGGQPPFFWTGDLFYGDNTKVWCTNAGGGLGPHAKTATVSAGGTNRHLSRFVRNAKPTIGHNYCNNNDGTVTDLDTGLMWAQAPSPALNWNSALNHAEGLTTAGFTDWRLPNIKELQSLVDIPRALATSATTAPCINRTLFPAVTGTALWSSTAVKSGTPTQAWLVDFGVTSTSTPSRNQQGIVSYEPFASTYPALAVRTAAAVGVTQQIAVEQPAGVPLTDGISTVAYGNVNTGSFLIKAFTIKNNSSTSDLTLTGTTIDGTHAALFTVTTAPASSIPAGGSTTMVVQFAPASGGAKTAALHLASGDSSVGAAFDINLTGTGTTAAPAITNVTTNPAVPTNTDTPYVTAVITPGTGAAISGVTLTYSTGAQVTGPAFREIFSNGATASGLAGAMNAWTATASTPSNLKQRGATGNRTVPIVLANGATTNSSTTVSCTSTTGLIPGMLISGTNIQSGATINSVTNGTTFVISSAATATGSGLSFTAAGVTLTGCNTTSASTTVTCLSTNGLITGMGVSGAITNPPNPTIATITPPSTFTLNSPVTTGAANITLTAGGTGLEFSNGTANLTDTMAATTNVISATTPTAGTVEFWVRNADLVSGGGWTFQMQDALGAWNTRLSESFAAASAANCTLNATTTVTCNNTSGLTVGNSIQGTAIPIAACGTSTSTTVTTVNTGSLAVGMFISGPNAAGLPANTRITAINPGTGFTLSAATTATAANQTLAANYLPGNATVSAITPNVSFTLSTAAFFSGSGITLSSINHGFQLRQYSLAAADRHASMKMRFQYSGYAGAVAPARPPAVNIDDITVTLTTGAAPVQIAMFDDGLNGDGAAGDGIYGAALPAQAAGTTVNYSIAATDNGLQTTTIDNAGTYTTGTAPPNVLIILTDDQGWGDVGYHTAAGQVPIQTPNMDSLGTTGIRLEKFHATTVCSVTRGALLTGRNSLRTGVGNTKGLGLAEHLMPQTFKAAGYQTFMCGKWHIGGWNNNINTTTMNGSTIEVQQEGAEYLPHNRGWDFHKGQYGGAINYFTHTSVDPGKNNQVDWWQNGAPLPNDNTDLQGNGGYSTDLLADKAVELIQTRNPAKPLLMYLAFNAIHAGVAAPAAYLNKYAALGVPLPRRTICAAVDCMDVAMGRVLGALDTAGITNNTLVIFMSDNGGENSAGGLNTPLRGTKGDSYDGGLHTPAGIRWPGRLAAGVTSHQYVWVGDIFPTVCAATGVTPLNPKPFDGINLWPALRSITPANPNGAPRAVPLITGDSSAPVAFNTFTDPVNGGNKVFKLIRSKSGSTFALELFNMTDDPYEAADLLLGVNAATYSTIVSNLTTAITAISAESYAPYVGPPGIAQNLPQGSSRTLYAPFTSYGKVPAVQWRKGGVDIGGATNSYQITNITGGNVNGVYMAILALNNVNGTSTGNYDVVVTSQSGSATSTAGILTVIKPASTQNDGLPDVWKLANGIDPNSNAAINGPLGDIDRDGRPNLLEYAFNTSPRSHENDPVKSFAATKPDDGLNYLVVSYPRRIGAVDLLYTVEISDGPGTLPSAGSASEPVSIVANPDDLTETVTVRILPAMTNEARKFVRIRVTAQ